jgi:hypothetical protein
MTEKFFERALFPRLFQLNCGKSRVRGLGAKHPKKRTKKSLSPQYCGVLPFLLKPDTVKRGNNPLSKKVKKDLHFLKF